MFVIAFIFSGRFYVYELRVNLCYKYFVLLAVVGYLQTKQKQEAKLSLG